MTDLFHFESDFADTLRCIPMQVRFKLDTSGVKLKLPHWNQFTAEERRSVLEAPCTTETEIANYRSLLRALVHHHTGDFPSDLPVEDHPEWMNPAQIPDSVRAQAETVQATITLDQWAALTPIQRFVLIKLSRSNHENKNFLPALKEFQIV